MSETTTAIVPSNTGALMPVLGIQDAIARYNAVIEFTRKVMKSGKDYGAVPGTGNKPTLLKPGAEKLCSLFGLCPEFIVTDKIVDFEKGLFYFEHRCDLYHNGVKVGSGIGSCNSKEKKYRYRNLTEKQASEEDKARAIRVEEKSGQYGKYKVYVVENLEPFDLVNTINKMSQKRALVAATLITANASEFFTQDIEDMDFIDGDWHESPQDSTSEVNTQQPSQPAQPPAEQPKTNGHTNAANTGWNPVAVLVEAGISENANAAATLLNKYVPKEFRTPEKLEPWGRLYRGWRDMGADSKAAAENATQGIAP